MSFLLLRDQINLCFDEVLNLFSLRFELLNQFLGLFHVRIVKAALDEVEGLKLFNVPICLFYLSSLSRVHLTPFPGSLAASKILGIPDFQVGRDTLKSI